MGKTHLLLTAGLRSHNFVAARIIHAGWVITGAGRPY